jgi:hypothetical protein
VTPVNIRATLTAPIVEPITEELPTTPSTQPIAGTRPSKLRKPPRSRTEPILTRLRLREPLRSPTDPAPDRGPPKRTLPWPNLSELSALPRPNCGSGEDGRPRQGFRDYATRVRRNAIKVSAQALKKLRVTIKAMKFIFLLKSKVRARRAARAQQET